MPFEISHIICNIDVPAGIMGDSFPKVSKRIESILEITTRSSLALATFILAVSCLLCLEATFASGPRVAEAAEMKDLTDDMAGSEVFRDKAETIE